MAIVLTGNANWSTCKAGGPPAEDDDIYLDVYALSLDGDNGSTYTCNSIKAVEEDGTTPTAGTIVLVNATSMLETSITAGSATLLTIDTDKVVTNLQTVTGGSAASAYGVRVNTNGTVSMALSLGGAAGPGCTNVGGTATAAEARGSAGAVGLVNYATANVTLAVGGTASGNHGLVNRGIAVVGTAKGGTHASAHGIYHEGGEGKLLTLGAVDLTGTGMPLYVPGLRLATAASVRCRNSTNTADITLHNEAGLPTAAQTLYNISRWSGATSKGTLNASNIGTATGTTNLTASMVDAGTTVGDVVGTRTTSPYAVLKTHDLTDDSAGDNLNWSEPPATADVLVILNSANTGILTSSAPTVLLGGTYASCYLTLTAANPKVYLVAPCTFSSTAHLIQSGGEEPLA